MVVVEAKFFCTPGCTDRDIPWAHVLHAQVNTRLRTARMVHAPDLISFISGTCTTRVARGHACGTHAYQIFLMCTLRSVDVPMCLRKNCRCVNVPTGKVPMGQCTFLYVPMSIPQCTDMHPSM